jgi:succinate dehydrogenase/fumarate reductase flavoprotein subunit
MGAERRSGAKHIGTLGGDTMPDPSPSTLTCDVLVIGSGTGGLSTAVTARKNGLDVLVIEKEPYFGGTTAFSGGVLWVPGNHHAKQNGVTDTREAARTYLRNETGNFFKADAVEAFLDNAPRCSSSSSARPR